MGHAFGFTALPLLFVGAFTVVQSHPISAASSPARSVQLEAAAGFDVDLTEQRIAELGEHKSPQQSDRAVQDAEPGPFTVAPNKSGNAATHIDPSAVRRHPVELVSDEDLCDTLASSARENGVPVAFFGNLIWQESRFDPGSISRAGAQGVAQFMPGTAAQVGLQDPFDPFQALPASARLLRQLFDQLGNFGLAAAAYNAGPGRVMKWLTRGGELPRETQAYVRIITGRPVEEWRSPDTRYSEFKLSKLPCRGMPAFAGLEQFTGTERSRANQPQGIANTTAASNADGLRSFRTTSLGGGKKAISAVSHGRGLPERKRSNAAKALNAGSNGRKLASREHWVAERTQGRKQGRQGRRKLALLDRAGLAIWDCG